jgi:hypothetical protein
MIYESNEMMDLARQLEQVLIKNKAEYPSGFAATLCLACICANELGMTRESFIKYCLKMFDHDKNEVKKVLQ